MKKITFNKFTFSRSCYLNQSEMFSRNFVLVNLEDKELDHVYTVVTSFRDNIRTHVPTGSRMPIKGMEPSFWNLSKTPTFKEQEARLGKKLVPPEVREPCGQWAHFA